LNAGRHSVGWTIGLAVLLTVGLSLAPIPDAYRPIPGLGRERLDLVVTNILLPGRTGSGRPQDTVTGAPEALAVDVATETPLDPPEPAPVVAIEASEPVRVLTPLAPLGNHEARSAQEYDRLGAKVGVAQADIEQGCLEPLPEGGCARWALDSFFEGLEALALGQNPKPVRVVHLGDSLIVSDHTTDIIRRRLELRFGSGGRGFLFVDRPTKFSGRKVRTGEASPGWELTRLTDKGTLGILGFSGVRFLANGPEQTRYAVGGSRVAELFFQTGPQGGTLEVKADDRTVSQILTRFAKPDIAFSRVRLPQNTEELVLKTRGGPVAVYGVSLENGRPGVVYDSVGIPGATARTFLKAPERAFSVQLARRSPSLVVLMLGGNDAWETSRGRMTLEDVQSDTAALIDRIRAAAPETACLLMAPMESATRTVGGELETRPLLDEVARIQHEVALSKGCGFWNMREAMGGPGALSRWVDAGLMNPDLIHPRIPGADLLGHLFDLALERARVARPKARYPTGLEPAGLVDSSGRALERVFARLRELEDGRGARVSIVQLGPRARQGTCSPTELREGLSRRFGDAGRGFVAVGKPSTRLTRQKVRRELTGEWSIPDAREAGPGEPWGLTGVRAEGQPKATATLSFGEGLKSDKEPGKLAVYYLETPEMGRMDVRLDGKKVAELPEAPVAEQAARIATFPVVGASHTVELVNLGPGPIALFGAALDLDTRGIIYDALGLPGATSMLADGFDKGAFVEQLRGRDAELYVLFYGTNEAALPDLDSEALRVHYTSLLGTLRTATPQAECLVLGPTDRLEKAADGHWREAPSTERVIQVLREVAEKEGCAFWSPRAAMGGPRSMSRWQSFDPPLGHPDGIHLTQEGYESLARMLLADLLDAYRAQVARDEGR